MPPIEDLLPLVLILFAVGAVAGVIAGLLGVGGGIVLVPAFFFMFQSLGYGGDQLMQLCLGTSLATIVVTSARSLQGHHKKQAVDWEILRKWTPGIAAGAILGVWIATEVQSIFLQLLFGVLGLLVALYLGFGKPHWQLAPALPQGPARHASAGGLGLLSVLMGIGGGSLGVPLMSLCGIPIHRAVATASGFGLIIAVPGTLGFMLATIDGASRPPLSIGTINIPAFLIVISMTFLTTPLGVRLAHKLNPAPLKKLFAVFLGLVGCNMIYTAMFA